MIQQPKAPGSRRAHDARAAGDGRSPSAEGAPPRRRGHDENDGNRLGPWRLAGRLGRGQWAEVFEAMPADAESRAAAYAVKVLREQWRHHADAIEALRREARVAAEVAHPRLVTVLSAAVDQPPHYLVMPKLQGDTLASPRRFGVSMALCIARQVAEALAALADAGWLHGDVKPANIVVSPGGHVTLIDLGCCRRLDEASPPAFRGTVAYAAPETLTSSMVWDIRSEIYSLGVVLFELLEGGHPFPGRDAGETAHHHLATPAPDLRRRIPHLSSEVARLVASMLAKEPLRRPQSAATLIHELVALEIATLTDRAPPPSG